MNNEQTENYVGGMDVQKDHVQISFFPIKRWQINRLFFPGVIYEEEEIQRIISLPVWLRYIRIVFVWSFDWLSPATRARLGFR